MDAITCLTTRHSVRRMTGAAVPAEAVRAIITAGQHAPTANNQQIWTFVTITDRTRLAELQALCPKNAPFLTQAGLAVLVTCSAGKYFLEDGCAAATNMLNAAHALGCGGCWIAGHGKDYASAVLQWAGAPAGQELVAIVVIGQAEPAAAAATPKKPLAAIWRHERFDGEAGQ
ncbi:MAG TPA: nitroreductase family protein [bacterium]|nr:nitroreductase family protein [bacterium]